MHGRTLATTESILAIASPTSDGARETLRQWVGANDMDLSVVEVGESIDDHYDETRATLGLTLGGDGTFLEGIKTFAPRSIPVLGINTGTLAFLTRVDPGDLGAALDETVGGRATVDYRQQLQVSAAGVDATGINDVTVQHIQPDDPVDRKISRLHVFADDEYVGVYGGTGLAVSTPTGSTGLSLSAGGPVHYPKNNHTLQVVPLHTHRMGVRPLIVDAGTTLEIVAERPVELLVDGGRSRTVLDANEAITISGASKPAQVVRTSYDDHFFTAISKKLGWGLRNGDDSGPRHLLDADAGEKGAEDVITRARRIATEAAYSAGEILRERHGQVESVEYKTDKADIVTEADYQSEHVITTVIRNEFPDHSVRSEEDVQYEGESEYCWLIDPLDGTGNFAHGNPNYAISIALLRGNEPVLGVVYAPETDELFTGTADGDASENGTPLSTTDRDSLDESMLISGYDPDGTFLSHFYANTRGVRRLGASALNLCYLASGSADAVWEFDTYPWDVAAGLVIARAAGARLTDATGNPYTLDLDRRDRRTELLASNGPLHAELLSHLERATDELRNCADESSVR